MDARKCIPGWKPRSFSMIYTIGDWPVIERDRKLYHRDTGEELVTMSLKEFMEQELNLPRRLKEARRDE